jgi:hypothetical protein
VVVDAYVDPRAPIQPGINTPARGRLVGRGRPLSAGVHTDRQKSPGAGALAYMTWVGTSPDPSEAPLTAALLSFSVYAVTEEAARKGAIALANWLRQAEGQPIPLGEATLACCDDITGPRIGPDGAYLVDATLTFEPSS